MEKANQGLATQTQTKLTNYMCGSSMEGILSNALTPLPFSKIQIFLLQKLNEICHSSIKKVAIKRAEDQWQYNKRQHGLLKAKVTVLVTTESEK